MRTFLLSGLFLVLSVVSVHAEESINGVGSYVWNATESKYASGAYATAQTMEITKLEENFIAVSQNVTLVGGQNFSWNIESPFDGVLRHASAWMSFGFKRTGPNAIHNKYKMDDGQEGEETFIISPKKVVIEGHSFKDGKKMPYVEVWDRVEKK
ncbi:MAG: hypothetical protein K2P94_00295 [Rhodospirillaceae bacterium]|nr:hypothetical protein [Rhodospirillaceae bacterium]